MSRPGVVLLVLVGALLGALADHRLFASRAAHQAPALKQPTAPALPLQESAACIATRAQLLAAVAKRAEPECVPAPSNATPDRPGACDAELAACRRERNRYGAQLIGCVNATDYDPGNLPHAGGDPARTYDVAVYVKRPDGSARVYQAGEWPDGSPGFVYAKQAKGFLGSHMGRVLWAPPDGGPWPDEIPDAGALFSDTPWATRDAP